METSAKPFSISDKSISPASACEDPPWTFSRTPRPGGFRLHLVPLFLRGICAPAQGNIGVRTVWVCPLIPKDSEGESWGLARHFKTSNGSLRMLPTSIRGRLWKLGFEGPDPTFAGFLVIPKGSERDFQVPPVGILGHPWNIQNR